ncbi:cyclopropane-fatty-acyl-phospholipid synthase family protein [soil metagenome]
MAKTKLRYTLLDRALGRGLIPDRVLRAGSRAGAAARIRQGAAGGVEVAQRRKTELVQRMSSGPVAEQTEEANEQHYELPAEFFSLFLGPRKKYSGCLWPAGVNDIAGAEEAMLRLTCERAGIADGMEILELGCGWGAVSLWMAEKYPNAQILGVSNSNGQREWITARAEERGLRNLEIRTVDVNDLSLDRRFDRIISIEMFEHMRNWRELLSRCSGWLEPNGRLFVHVFSQREHPYRFVDSWASERFFSGGVMPSHDLMLHFQDDLSVLESWAVSGTHSATTLQAWLADFDANIDRIRAALSGIVPGGPRRVEELIAQWRLFLISTDEIWGYRRGDEWLVSHYLLGQHGDTAPR